MSKHVAFVTDTLDQLGQKNETLALMQAAQKHGYQVHWMGASDLHIRHNEPVGYMTPIQFIEGQVSFTLGKPFLAPLSRLDLVWWRKRPPYGVDQLVALQALQMVNEQVKVVNQPTILKNLNEHLFMLQFPSLIPRSLVTKNPDAIQAFLDEVGGKASLRSLKSSPGSEFFFLRKGDANLSALSNTVTNYGSDYALVQKWLSEPGSAGEKRLFLLDGELLGAAQQIQGKGELRGSFDRGARAQEAEVNDKDRALINVLSPVLKQNGIFLATFDVCDGLVFDCNFSAPNGYQKLQEVSSENIYQKIFAAL